MSISPSLQASARAAYRSLFRAASVTFRGDDRVLNAFLWQTRTAYRNGRSLTDEEQYKEKIQLAREIASFVRRNVVQAQKSPNGDAWKLNINHHTELGDNNTIKKASRDKSLRGEGTSTTSPTLITDTRGRAPPRVNFSALKRLHQTREVPRLNERDIEEVFVRGSGPGGQSINKTENCVQILHKPTGLRVSCQETRSLEQNRRIARKLLIEKLDQLQNPGLSKKDVKRAQMNERERQKRKKRRKKEKQLASAVK